MSASRRSGASAIPRVQASGLRSRHLDRRVSADLRQRARVRRHDRRSAARHRLERDHPETLVERRHGNHLGRAGRGARARRRRRRGAGSPRPRARPPRSARPRAPAGRPAPAASPAGRPRPRSARPRPLRGSSDPTCSTNEPSMPSSCAAQRRSASASPGRERVIHAVADHRRLPDAPVPRDVAGRRLGHADHASRGAHRARHRRAKGPLHRRRLAAREQQRGEIVDRHHGGHADAPRQDCLGRPQHIRLVARGPHRQGEVAPERRARAGAAAVARPPGTGDSQRCRFTSRSTRSPPAGSSDTTR